MGSFASILAVLDDDPLPRGTAWKATLGFAFCVLWNPPVDIPGDVLDDIPGAFGGVAAASISLFIHGVVMIFKKIKKSYSKSKDEDDSSNVFSVSRPVPPEIL